MRAESHHLPSDAAPQPLDPTARNPGVVDQPAARDIGFTEADRDERRVPPRFRWLPWLVLAAVLYAALLIGVRFWWAAETQRRLDETVARYRTLGQPVLLVDFQRPAIPDDEDGGPLLSEALAKLTLTNEEREWIVASGDLAATRDHLDRLRPILEKCGASHELAGRAFARPHITLGPEITSPAIGIMLPHLSSMRLLARTLALRAIVAHAEGDELRALEAVELMLASGRALQQSTPTTITTLTRVAVDALTISRIAIIAPDLAVDGPRHEPSPTRVAVRRLIETLLDESSLRASFRDALFSERFCQLDCAQLIANGALTLPMLTTGFGAAPPPPPPTFESSLAPMFLLDGLAMMEWTDALIRAVEARDWPAAQVLLRGAPALSFTGNLDSATHLLARLLYSPLERAVMLQFRSLAERRMAAIALAMRLYELDHGARPSSLDALVPEYLAAIPPDPFAADGRPVSYLPDAEMPRLYSVGVNCADDGGAFGLRGSGDVNPDGPDLPFFLTHDRPRAATTLPAESVATSQPADSPEP